MMKMKISLKNFKNVLNRDEMREIKGGTINYLAGPPPDGSGECDSDCEPPPALNKCAHPGCPNSYCATVTCGSANVRKYTCQYQ